MNAQSRPFRIPADTFNIRQCRSTPCSPTLLRKPAFADGTLASEIPHQSTHSRDTRPSYWPAGPHGA